jgi:hypothetical protein
MFAARFPMPLRAGRGDNGDLLEQPGHIAKASDACDKDIRWFIAGAHTEASLRSRYRRLRDHGS